jgi:hypothetical protein
MDDPTNWFGFVVNIAAIVTALVAFVGSAWYIIERGAKRHRLEAYLKAERDKSEDEGQRSILHLIARAGLTEQEILQASFRSKHIGRVLTTNKHDGIAKTSSWSIATDRRSSALTPRGAVHTVRRVPPRPGSRP